MKSVSSFLATAVFASGLLGAAAQTPVWTYHNNNFRTGANTSETVLTPANVNSTTFGKLYTYPVDGYVYAQPLYVPNVAIPGRGLHNVFFVATEHDSVYALDADSAGAAGGVLWQTSLGVSAVTTVTGVFTNRNFGTRYNGNAYTDITPEVGITATPVIDTNTGTLYVDAFTGEIGGGVTNYIHRLHALNIATGAEQSNSPVVVTASVAGTGVDSVGGRVTFNAKQENARVALTLAGGTVYLTFTSYADTDPYHGWIIGYNAATLAPLTNYVFNTTPNSTTALYGSNAGEGGIWMGGNGLGVDANTNLYFFVGNGIFNVTNSSGKTEFGDSVIKLSTVNGLALADYFTPYNQLTLAANDTDLGSGGMVLLPDQPGPNPHVLLGAGKAGVIYTINRDQFTTNNNHYNASTAFDYVLQSTSGRVTASFGTPAYFNGRIYNASSGDYLKALTISNGLITSATTMTNAARTFGFPGATVSLSANGTNNGIVWAIQKASPALLVACNATNFTTELYNSGQAAGSRDVPGNGVKFAAPTVADGKVIIGNIGSVSVYGLLAGTLAFDAPSYAIQEANTSITIGVNRLGGTSGAVAVNYATAGGSAMAGVDYSAVSGTLTWASGDAATKYFSVPIFATGVVNPNKTINLALSNPTGNAALAPQSAVVLSITPTPTEAWKLAQFGANANLPGVAGDAADPDNDGIANLLEYAYNTDPDVYNNNPFTANLAGQQFQLHFPRNTSATDITYVLQSSTTLTNWIALETYTAAAGWQANAPGAAVTESGAIGVVPNAYVNVTVTSTTNVLMGSAPGQFLRLQIHR